MSVLRIAGSPSERPRAAALLEAAGQRLETRGALVERLRIRDLSLSLSAPAA
jgi:FMN reductase